VPPSELGALPPAAAVSVAGLAAVAATLALVVEVEAELLAEAAGVVGGLVCGVAQEWSVRVDRGSDAA